MGFLQLFTGSNRGAPVSTENPVPVTVVSGGGGGAGTSDTTEATQLLVKTAVETIANDGATEATQADILAALETQATSIPHEALDATTDLTVVSGTRSTSGETSLVGATASQTTRVHEILVTAAGAVTVSLLDGSGGTVLRKMVFPDKGGIHRKFRARPYAKTTANTALYFSTNAAVQVDIEIDYVKSA
jgi:hypothetical protein